ncbi:MAG: MgtC/SapB family protein, partial [Clostridia bacterium]|nr:MgtC/SapB family protein [Clostridia bacterium]
MAFWELKFDPISITFMLELILRILASGLCGAIVGYERSKRLKEAGVRTHCVVAMAAALIMVVSKYGFADVIGSGFITGVDGARLGAQVISGVGFLGAGVIFKNGNVVRGITTAAGIWATAAIGLTLGSGLYIIGITTTVVIMLVQFIMHKFPVGNDAFNTNEIEIIMHDTPETRELLKTQFDSKLTLIVG